MNNPTTQNTLIAKNDEVTLAVKVLSISWVASAIIICTINIVLTCKLIKQLSGENMIAATKYSAKLKWFPIAQTLCFVPFFVNQILEAIFNKEIFALYLIENIFFCIRGLIFAVIFAYTSKIKSNVVYSMRNLINNKQENDNPEIRVQMERLDTLSESTFEEKNEIEIRNFSFTSTGDITNKAHKNKFSLNSSNDDAVNRDRGKRDSNLSVES